MTVATWLPITLNSMTVATWLPITFNSMTVATWLPITFNSMSVATWLPITFNSMTIGYLVTYNIKLKDSGYLVTYNIQLFSFTLVTSCRSSSLLSANRVVSSAYLKLFIFLPPILTPMSSSSKVACLMMYSLYGLNRHGERTHPCLTPFPIEKLSVSPYSVRSFASWFAYSDLIDYCEVPNSCAVRNNSVGWKIHPN